MFVKQRYAYREMYNFFFINICFYYNIYLNNFKENTKL